MKKKTDTTMEKKTDTTMEKKTDTTMKKKTDTTMKKKKLECCISSLVGSLNIEFVNVYKKTLSAETFGKIRQDVINYLIKKGMKMSYSPQWQYTFIKIFYETQEEEKLALELTLGVKSIIDKYGKN